MGEEGTTHWYCPQCGVVLNTKTERDHTCSAVAKGRQPTDEEHAEAYALVYEGHGATYRHHSDVKASFQSLIMQRNDLAALLRETCAVIGQDHICQTRQFDGSDCGRCFSCCCGQLRQHIDAALGEPNE